MSQENKTVFHVIREKAAAKAAVALIAVTLLAGAGLAFPPGPSAPMAGVIVHDAPVAGVIVHEAPVAGIIVHEAPNA